MFKLQVVICSFFILYLTDILQEIVSKIFIDINPGKYNCNNSIFTGKLLEFNSLLYFVTRIIHSSTAVCLCLYLFWKTKSVILRSKSSSIIGTNGAFRGSKLGSSINIPVQKFG